MNYKIKYIREETKTKQEDLAKELKIPQSNYSRYEKNPNTLPIERYIKLAQYYNTSIDYLVGLTDETKPYPRIKKNEQ